MSDDRLSSTAPSLPIPRTTICCGSTAPAGWRAELLAMPLVQPLISLVDTGVGHVRQIATGLHQIRLPGQVAPDDAHLLAGTLTTQGTTQLVIGLGHLHGAS